MPILFLSGVYLVFEVFQERAFKEMLAISNLILQACIVFEVSQTRVAHVCFRLVRAINPVAHLVAAMWLCPRQ